MSLERLFGQIGFLEARESEPHSAQRTPEEVAALKDLLWQPNTTVGLIKKSLSKLESRDSFELSVGLATLLFERLCKLKEYKLIISIACNHLRLQDTADIIVSLVQQSSSAERWLVLDGLARACLLKQQRALLKMFLQQLDIPNLPAYLKRVEYEANVTRTYNPELILDITAKIERAGLTSSVSNSVVVTRLLALKELDYAVPFLLSNDCGKEAVSSCMSVFHADAASSKRFVEKLKLHEYSLTLADYTSLAQCLDDPQDLHIAWDECRAKHQMAETDVLVFIEAAAKLAPESLAYILRTNPFPTPVSKLLQLLVTSAARPTDSDEPILQVLNVTSKATVIAAVEQLIVKMDRKTRQFGRESSCKRALMRVLRWLDHLPFDISLQLERMIVKQVFCHDRECVNQFLKSEKTSPGAVLALLNHHLRKRRLDDTEGKHVTGVPGVDVLEQTRKSIDTAFFMDAITALERKQNLRGELELGVSQTVSTLITLRSPTEAVVILNWLSARDWKFSNDLLQRMVRILVDRKAFRGAKEILDRNPQLSFETWKRYLIAASNYYPHLAIVSYTKFIASNHRPTYQLLEEMSLSFSKSPHLSANVATTFVRKMLREMACYRLAYAPPLAKAIAYVVFVRQGPRTSYLRYLWGYNKIRSILGSSRAQPLLEILQNGRLQGSNNAHWRGGYLSVKSSQDS